MLLLKSLVTLPLGLNLVKPILEATTLPTTVPGPWSSGYGKRLSFRRSWVRIVAPYTGWKKFTYICCKNCNDVCLKRPKINKKEAGVGPFKKTVPESLPKFSIIAQHFWVKLVRKIYLGSGSVGRAPASDTRGPRFESSHRQKFIYWTIIYCQLYWKDKNKGKRGREWHNFLKNILEPSTILFLFLTQLLL